MLRVRRSHPDAVLPSRGSEQSIGYDLTSVENVVIPKGEYRMVDTGIQVEFPDGHYLRIAPRSGLTAKNGIHVGAGVVDRDYRANIKVILFNFGSEDFDVRSGMRIAQAILEKASILEVEEVSDLSSTERGEGGFGSTGV